VQAEIERRHSGEHPADEGGNFGIVTAEPNDPLNLRVKPSTSATVLKTLDHGTKVAVLGGKKVGSTRWLNVVAAGTTGWVAARYMDLV